MGCSSSVVSSYIVQYCSLEQIQNKENIYQINLIDEETILKEERQKIIDQIDKNTTSSRIKEFLNRDNFETHTMFYFFLREEPVLKNYEQAKKYFPYNLPQLYKVILLSTENKKNLTNLIIENKTKSIKESNFIGYKLDFNDMEKVLEEVNNSKITKDSLSLDEEDFSDDEDLEEKESEIIIFEEIREETYKRVYNKFKSEIKEDNNFESNNNLETTSNVINSIGNKKNNNKIKSVKIIESKIEDLQIFNKIMKFISKKSIKKFYFVGNNINSDFEGWTIISSFLEQNYQLRYLDLHNSTIYDYHLNDIMRPLSDKRIRFLNLSENFITLDGSTTLQYMIII